MNHDGKMYFLDPIPNASFCDLLMLYLCGTNQTVYTPLELAMAAKAERKAEQFTIGNPCACCNPYELKYGGKKVATVEKPGDCANGTAGFWLLCCPFNTLFVCSGHYKHLIVNGPGEKKLEPKFMILQEFVPLWTIAPLAVSWCLPCAASITALLDCLSICEGKVAKQISQPVYRAIKFHKDKAEKVGDIVVTVFAMCSMNSTWQTEFKPVEGFVPTKEELHSLTLLLQMYEGHRMVDCSLPGRPVFPKPTGNPLADFGLNGSVKRMSIGELMQAQAAALGLGTAEQRMAAGDKARSLAVSAVAIGQEAANEALVV